MSSIKKNGSDLKTILEILLVPLGFLSVFSLILYGIYLRIPQIKTFFDSNNNDFLLIVTAVIAYANLVLAYITGKSLHHSKETNERAERIFQGQIRPLVDAAPIAVEQSSCGRYTKTYFSVVNYSGFIAKDVVIDLKYGSNSWIQEWIKAKDEMENKTEQGVVPGKIYTSEPARKIETLKPGDTIYCNNKGEKIFISGSLNLEKTVCNNEKNVLSVLVRISWKNEKGHAFDAVKKYSLVCTKAGKEGDKVRGRAFTFIPQGPEIPYSVIPKNEKR